MNQLSSFGTENSSFLEQIEAELQRILGESELATNLGEACSYSVFPAGKRIRPKFLQSVLTDLKGMCEASTVTVACAIELLHCASLVHDDLPELDNDDIRRGKPTTHKKFGQATALLSGDAIVPIAIGALTKLEISKDARLELISVLSKAYVDLLSGQELDLPSNDSDRSEDLFLLYRLKTGALFGAAAECAAILKGCDSETRKFCFKFGETFGVLFQIADDIDDSDDSYPITDAYKRISGELSEILSALEKRKYDLKNSKALVQSLLERLVRSSVPR